MVDSRVSTDGLEVAAATLVVPEAAPDDAVGCHPPADLLPKLLVPLVAAGRLSMLAVE